MDTSWVVKLKFWLVLLPFLPVTFHFQTKQNLKSYIGSFILKRTKMQTCQFGVFLLVSLQKLFVILRNHGKISEFCFSQKCNFTDKICKNSSRDQILIWLPIKFLNNTRLQPIK
jgi:hypothetical protein